MARRESEHTDKWFVDPVYGEMFRRLMEEGSIPELKADPELSELIAEMLTVEVVGDHEVILRRHSNAYYKRLIASEEAAYKAAQDGRLENEEDRYALGDIKGHLERVKALRGKIVEVK